VIRYFPFHGARKWRPEGHRTREAHVLCELIRRLEPSSVVVLNRPTCLTEALPAGGMIKPLTCPKNRDLYRCQ